MKSETNKVLTFSNKYLITSLTMSGKVSLLVVKVSTLRAEKKQIQLVRVRGEWTEQLPFRSTTVGYHDGGLELK